MTQTNDHLITALYKWITTFKGNPVVKDTSKIHNIKFDGFIDSSIRDPLSFTVFELSDKGELLIDDASRIAASQAAFFLFVNHKTGWLFAIKNTLENQKKLMRNEPIQNFKIKILQ
ncbi:MAG: hypothetical protein K6C94_03810 [Candidatus Gastranaerophilales bacterium]|nr:hypothetical protein [Candidatus Gastranaerophilales bacterium]